MSDNQLELPPAKFSLQNIGDLRRIEEIAMVLNSTLITCKVINEVIADVDMRAGKFAFERNIENARLFESLHDEVRTVAADLLTLETSLRRLSIPAIAEKVERLKSQLLEDQLKLVPWNGDRAKFLRSLISDADKIWQTTQWQSSDDADTTQREVDQASRALRELRKCLKNRDVSERLSFRFRRAIQRWMMLFRERAAGEHWSDDEFSGAVQRYRRRFDRLAARLR